jgi:hypothetical protein
VEFCCDLATGSGRRRDHRAAQPGRTLQDHPAKAGGTVSLDIVTPAAAQAAGDSGSIASLSPMVAAAGSAPL